MKRFVVRAALVGAGLAVLGLIVSASGVIPIKASSGHWPITEWFLRFSMKRSIATHSLGTEVPENLADLSLVQTGAAHYELACRWCHGEPQGARPRVAAHMLPVPPDLAPRVRESEPKKLFEVVKHGMKFTGMPAWPAQQRDDEVWAVVAFLVKYPELSTTEYRRLAGREEMDRGSGPKPPIVAHSCVRCHGHDGLGRGNPLVPRLAGQRPAYLLGALRAYAANRRHSGIMEPPVAELGPHNLKALAQHYASLPATSAPVLGPRDPAAVLRGEAIARNGIRSQRVAACLECHGPTGHRTKPEFPNLAGQSAAYLERQLMLFRENRRGGSDHVHLMQAIASRLTPEQARDAAQFFASLPPEAE